METLQFGSRVKIKQRNGEFNDSSGWVLGSVNENVTVLIDGHGSPIILSKAHLKIISGSLVSKDCSSCFEKFHVDLQSPDWDFSKRSGIDITKDDCRHIEEALAKVPTVSKLILGNYPYSPEIKESIDAIREFLKDAVPVTTSLETLDLTNTGIGTSGIRMLADALEENASLTTIKIGGCGSDDDGREYLASMLGKNYVLTKVEGFVAASKVKKKLEKILKRNEKSNLWDIQQAENVRLRSRENAESRRRLDLLQQLCGDKPAEDMTMDEIKYELTARGVVNYKTNQGKVALCEIFNTNSDKSADYGKLSINDQKSLVKCRESRRNTTPRKRSSSFPLRPRFKPYERAIVTGMLGVALSELNDRSCKILEFINEKACYRVDFGGRIEFIPDQNLREAVSDIGIEPNAPGKHGNRVAEKYVGWNANSREVHNTRSDRYERFKEPGSDLALEEPVPRFESETFEVPRLGTFSIVLEPHIYLEEKFLYPMLLPKLKDAFSNKSVQFSDPDDARHFLNFFFEETTPPAMRYGASLSHLVGKEVNCEGVGKVKVTSVPANQKLKVQALSDNNDDEFQIVSPEKISIECKDNMVFQLQPRKPSNIDSSSSVSLDWFSDPGREPIIQDRETARALEKKNLTREERCIRWSNFFIENVTCEYIYRHFISARVRDDASLMKSVYAMLATRCAKCFEHKNHNGFSQKISDEWSWESRNVLRSSDTLKRDPNFIRALMKENWVITLQEAVVEDISEDEAKKNFSWGHLEGIEEDRDLVKMAIVDGRANFCTVAGPGLYNDKDFSIELIESNVNVYSQCSDENLRDPDVIKKAIFYNGMIFNRISSELRLADDMRRSRDGYIRSHMQNMRYCTNKAKFISEFINSNKSHYQELVLQGFHKYLDETFKDMGYEESKSYMQLDWYHPKFEGCHGASEYASVLFEKFTEGERDHLLQPRTLQRGPCLLATDKRIVEAAVKHRDLQNIEDIRRLLDVAPADFKWQRSIIMELLNHCPELYAHLPNQIILEDTDTAYGKSILRIDGMNLRYFDEDRRTPEVCKLAVENCHPSEIRKMLIAVVPSKVLFSPQNVSLLQSGLRPRFCEIVMGMNLAALFEKYPDDAKNLMIYIVRAHGRFPISQDTGFNEQTADTFWHQNKTFATLVAGRFGCRPSASKFKSSGHWYKFKFLPPNEAVDRRYEHGFFLNWIGTGSSPTRKKSIVDDYQCLVDFFFPKNVIGSWIKYYLHKPDAYYAVKDEFSERCRQWPSMESSVAQVDYQKAVQIVIEKAAPAGLDMFTTGANDNLATVRREMNIELRSIERLEIDSPIKPRAENGNVSANQNATRALKDPLLQCETYHGGALMDSPVSFYDRFESKAQKLTIAELTASHLKLRKTLVASPHRLETTAATPMVQTSAEEVNQDSEVNIGGIRCLTFYEGFQTHHYERSIPWKPMHLIDYEFSSDTRRRISLADPEEKIEQRKRIFKKRETGGGREVVATEADALKLIEAFGEDEIGMKSTMTDEHGGVVTLQDLVASFDKSLLESKKVIRAAIDKALMVIREELRTQQDNDEDENSLRLTRDLWEGRDALRVACTSIRADSEFLHTVLQEACNNDINLFPWSSCQGLQDKMLVSSAIKVNAHYLTVASSSLLRDKSFIMYLLSLNHWVFEHCDATLRRDSDIVKMAVSLYGGHLHFDDVDPKFRSNPDIRGMSNQRFSFLIQRQSLASKAALAAKILEECPDLKFCTNLSVKRTIEQFICHIAYKPSKQDEPNVAKRVYTPLNWWSAFGSNWTWPASPEACHEAFLGWSKAKQQHLLTIVLHAPSEIRSNVDMLIRAMGVASKECFEQILKHEDISDAEKYDQKLFKAAVSRHGSLLSHLFADEKRIASFDDGCMKLEDLYHDAVKSDPSSLRFVPAEKRTLGLCLDALRACEDICYDIVVEEIPSCFYGVDVILWEIGNHLPSALGWHGKRFRRLHESIEKMAMAKSEDHLDFLRALSTKAFQHLSSDKGDVVPWLVPVAARLLTPELVVYFLSKQMDDLIQLLRALKNVDLPFWTKDVAIMAAALDIDGQLFDLIPERLHEISDVKKSRYTKFVAFISKLESTCNDLDELVWSFQTEGSWMCDYDKIKTFAKRVLVWDQKHEGGKWKVDYSKLPKDAGTLVSPQQEAQQEDKANAFLKQIDDIDNKINEKLTKEEDFNNRLPTDYKHDVNVENKCKRKQESHEAHVDTVSKKQRMSGGGTSDRTSRSHVVPDTEGVGATEHEYMPNQDTMNPSPEERNHSSMSNDDTHNSDADVDHTARRESSTREDKSVYKWITHAMVIGISEYKIDEWDNLPNAAPDAKNVAAALRRMGIKVFEYTNSDDLSLQKIKTKLNTFCNELDDDICALFYYSGHGITIDGKNYIVPADHEIRDIDNDDLIVDPHVVEDNSLGIDHILKRFEDAAQRAIVVLDCCREVPKIIRSGLMGTSRGGSVSLARNDSGYIPTNVAVVHSCQDRQLASDGIAGWGSPFARAFLDLLRKGPTKGTREYEYLEVFKKHARGKVRDVNEIHWGVKDMLDSLSQRMQEYELGHQQWPSVLNAQTAIPPNFNLLLPKMKAIDHDKRNKLKRKIGELTKRCRANKSDLKQKKAENDECAGAKRQAEIKCTNILKLMRADINQNIRPSLNDLESRKQLIQNLENYVTKAKKNSEQFDLMLKRGEELDGAIQKLDAQIEKDGADLEACQRELQHLT